MITVSLTEDDVDLIAVALTLISAPLIKTLPIIDMLRAEVEAAKALKTAVEPSKQPEPTWVMTEVPSAPYGLRKDGKPRGRPGRPKKKK